MCIWLHNYADFRGGDGNPPGCKGSPFELWGLIQYFAKSIPDFTREAYRKRIDRVYERKIRGEVWEQLLKQYAPTHQEKLQPLTEGILYKISRSFSHIPPFEGFHVAYNNHALAAKNAEAILQRISPLLTTFPLRTHNLQYAVDALEKYQPQINFSHERLMFAQYIGSVKYVSPECIGTAMEIWLLLRVSSMWQSGIISQQIQSMLLDNASRYLGKVYQNPNNVGATPDSSLGWLDASVTQITDKLGMWNYNEWREKQNQKPSSSAASLGNSWMYHSDYTAVRSTRPKTQQPHVSTADRSVSPIHTDWLDELDKP